MPSGIEKGTFYLILAQLVFLVTGYAIYFGLGRFLGPTQFGIYGVVMGFATMISMISVTGINQAVSKFVSEKEECAEAVKRKALKIQIIFGIILFALIFFLAPFIALALNDSNLTIFIQIASLLVLFHPIFSVFMGYLNGLKKFVLQAKINIAYLLIKLFLILGLVLLGFGIFGAITGFFSASLIAVLICLAFVKINKTKEKFDSKKMIDFMVPITFFAAITFFLLEVDLFSVKALTIAASSNAFAGYYTAASTIARIPQSLAYSFVIVLFPLISSTTFKLDLKKAREYISNSLRYSLLVLVPLVILIASTSKELISLVYSPSYLPGADALVLLSIALGFYSVFLIFAAIIAGSNNPKTIMIIGFFVLIIDILLNLFLVPRYQLIGAAMASLLSFVIGCLITGIFVFLKFKTLMKTKSFVKIIVAGTIVWFFSYYFFVSGLLLILKYVLLLGVYFLVLIALKEVGKKDWRLFLNIFK